MRGLTFLIVVVILGLVVFWALGYGARVATSPWSWSLFRKRTLTGSWYGTLHSEGGNDRAVFIEMHLPGRLRAGVNLTGSAQVCNHAGEETTYDVLGRTDGSTLSLKMVSGDPRQPSAIGTLDGTWSDDTLQLNGSIHSTQGKDDEWPRVSGSLKKGDNSDYRSMCKQISSFKK